MCVGLNYEIYNIQEYSWSLYLKYEMWVMLRFQPGVYPKYNFDPVGVAQAVILCDPYRVEPPFLPYPGLKPGAIDVHTYGVRAPFGILQIS